MDEDIPDWFAESFEHRNIWQPPLDYKMIGSKIDELESMVDAGSGETDVQEFLKPNPILFDGLYRHGHGTYLIPEQTIGRYRADWLAASGASGGISWDLIELECPQEVPFLKSGEFGKSARKGISQIEEWRRWIADNQQQVMSPRIQGGLGFHGLRSSARGIVIAGTRAKYNNYQGKDTYDRLRQTLLRDKFIELISFDTLFERMRFRLRD